MNSLAKLLIMIIGMRYRNAFKFRKKKESILIKNGSREASKEMEGEEKFGAKHKLSSLES